MSGRHFRRAAAAAALGLGAVLGALAVLHGKDVPVWSIPLLAVPARHGLATGLLGAAAAAALFLLVAAAARRGGEAGVPS